MRILLLTLPLLMTLLSCAGPMSPFGSNAPGPSDILGSMSSEKSLEDQASREVASMSYVIDLNNQVHPEVTVTFYPEVQLFHRSTDWKVEVFDEKGIPANSVIRLLYKGEDITDQVKKIGRLMASEDQTKMSLSIDGLSFPAGKEHDIALIYQRTPYAVQLETNPQTNNTFYRKYHPALCQLKKQDSLKNFGLFAKHEETLEMIERISFKEKTNPALMAGLVAQESGFDPRAVSWAKALGLTQVTSIAEEHILNDEKDWPSFPGIHQMNHLQVKSLVMLGKINKKNEWRLDREKSIIGGIDYLNYLEDYWTRPQNWNTLEQSMNSVQIDQDLLTQVILASYHSGAYRVKRAIASDADLWLSSDQLKGARFYVQKVSSYCHDFSTEYL